MVRYRGWIFKKPLPVVVAIATFICIFQFDLTMRSENESDLKMREKFRRHSVNRLIGYGLQERQNGPGLRTNNRLVNSDTLRVRSAKVRGNSDMDSPLLWVSKHDSNKKGLNGNDQDKKYNALDTSYLLKKSVIDPLVNEFDYKGIGVKVSQSSNEVKKQSNYEQVKEKNNVDNKSTTIRQKAVITNHDVVESQKPGSSINNTQVNERQKLGFSLNASESKLSLNNKKFMGITMVKEARSNMSKSARTRTARKFKARPFSEFAYPLNINISELYENYTKYGKVDVKAAWNYEMKFITTSNMTCYSGTGNTTGGYDDDEEEEGKIQLLFIIKSTPKHYQRRDAIRQTWVNETFVNGTSIKHIFNMGTTKQKHLQDRVDLEIKNYNDIVQMDFVDSYYNNTYKTVGAIQWVTKYCQNTKFIMFVDDDFYVALLSLIPFLKKIESNNTVDNLMEHLFLGNVIRKSQPWRNPINRWYTPPEDYPFEVYPPFCSAGSIITSFIFLKKLEFAIRYVKYFRYDDVYLGIILYKMGVELQHTDMVPMWKVSHKDEKFKQILSSHGYDRPKDLLKAFRCHVDNICGATMLEIMVLLTLYILLPSLSMGVIIWYLTCCIDQSYEETKNIRYQIRRR